MSEYYLSDLKAFCESQLKTFTKKQIILLEGELGMGKTTLVQTMADLLGFKNVESPTFSIINEYPTIPKIYHVDLYRLESKEDIESTGFWDLFNNDGGLIFVEWSNRVPDEDWPKSWSRVKWVLTPGASEKLRSIDVQKL